MSSPRRQSPPNPARLKGRELRRQGHFTLTPQEVKARARGRWLLILSALAPSLDAAIARPGHHVACPGHGGKDGFRVFRDAAETGGGCCNTCGKFADGLALLMWANGWTFQVALREVAACVGMISEAPMGSWKATSLPTPIIRTPVRREWARQALEKVWRASLPGDHPEAEPMRLYLAGRGLGAIPIPSALRYHPALPYHYEGQLIGTYPAMLALMVDADGKPVSVHRTYLGQDGRKAAPEWKGELLDSRKLMSPTIEGNTRGGAIRLFEAGAVLAVAEGIETALAYHLLTGLPTWAAVSAQGLEALAVPEKVETAVIACDLDAPRKTPKGLKCAGQEAAIELARRLKAEGRAYRFDLPPDLNPGGNTDWNDVLTQQGGMNHAS